MDKAEITERFDYSWASIYARSVAIGFGTRDGVPGDESDDDRLFDIAADIAEIVWDSALTDIEKLHLWADIYDDIPSYTLLAHFVIHRWPSLRSDPAKAEIRQAFWTQVKKWMSGPDDALAGPIGYALWCDYFEFPEDVEGAWNAHG